MKKIVFSLIFILPALSVFSQDFEPIFTMGINSGIDYNINAYQIPINSRFGYQYFGKPLQYNIGLDFGVAVTNKFRPRIELRFQNQQYGVNWNLTNSQGNIIYPVDMIQSIQNINYWDINIYLDYLLTKWKKLDIYASPGLKYEFETSDFLYTSLNDGLPTSSNQSILFPSFPRQIAAAAVSMIFKYNFTKHFGMTLTPEYTLFFRNYTSSNSQLYQRLNLNAGFEFRFN